MIQLSLLLIEDSEDFVFIVKRVLKKSSTKFIIDCAYDATDGLNKLVSGKYDIVLCDYRLPHGSAIDILTKAKLKGFDSPFVVMTSQGNEQIAVTLMKEGASDYVVKDSKTFDELDQTLIRVLKKHEEERQLENRKTEDARREKMVLARQRDAARQEAETDPLTGLYNRKKIDSDLGVFISDAKETSSSLSCILLDVDKFKTFNDEHGHRMGDDVLRVVAQVLRSNIEDHKGSRAYRFGGDEFFMMLPDFSSDEAVDFAEKLRVALQDKVITKKHDQVFEGTQESAAQVSLSVSGSFGVATVGQPAKERSKVEDGLTSQTISTASIIDSPRLLFDSADAMLYESKTAGRNCVAYMDEDGQIVVGRSGISIYSGSGEYKSHPGLDGDAVVDLKDRIESGPHLRLTVSRYNYFKKMKHFMEAAVNDRKLFILDILCKTRLTMSMLQSIITFGNNLINEDQLDSLWESLRDKIKELSQVFAEVYDGTDNVKVDVVKYLDALVAFLCEEYCVSNEFVSVKFDEESSRLNSEKSLLLLILIYEVLGSFMKLLKESKRSCRLMVSFVEVESGQFSLSIGIPESVSFVSEENLFADGIGKLFVQALSLQLKAMVRYDVDFGRMITFDFKS